MFCGPFVAMIGLNLFAQTNALDSIEDLIDYSHEFSDDEACTETPLEPVPSNLAFEDKIKR